MKKLNYLLVALLAFATLTTACKKKAADAAAATEEAACCGKCETEVPEANGVPAYVVINKPQVNLDEFAKDAEGFITLFDGTSFKGWRGYGKSEMPSRWVIEDGAIRFAGSGAGEAQDKTGGDIMFDYKFKNFELSFDWKVAKGSNSGVFFLAQEVKDQPIYISSPEYQILDNENHPDAKLGENGNRKSSSLYDMIPAVPQNSKPFGEWNTGGIMVYKGTVVHKQNGANVVEYHLWTPQWTELLQKSKFSQEKWPLAFELLKNLGGEAHEGYIGLQDHGDDVWYKNIRIKILD
ncbi:glycosyl hydrolase [Bacteroidia bacterium]|nr:glycosyl hydrolase [Bacteroidia bacterium]